MNLCLLYIWTMHDVHYLWGLGSPALAETVWDTVGSPALAETGGDTVGSPALAATAGDTVGSPALAATAGGTVGSPALAVCCAGVKQLAIRQNAERLTFWDTDASI